MLKKKIIKKYSSFGGTGYVAMRDNFVNFFKK